MTAPRLVRAIVRALVGLAAVSLLVVYLILGGMVLGVTGS